MDAAESQKLQAAELFGVPGLIAVVTGGGTGIGAMMTRALALNGAEAVFILGRRKDALEETCNSISGARVIPILCDVTSKTSLQASVNTIEEHVGRVDVLIANAGVNEPDVPMISPSSKEPLPFDQFANNIWATEFDAINDTFKANLTGTYFTIAAFLPLLFESSQTRQSLGVATPASRPRPQIITVSSAGAYNRLPLANLAYSASKAGVAHMTKLLATNLVEYGIRANELVPGVYVSAMTREALHKQGLEETVSWTLEGSLPKTFIPEARAGGEQDMAGAILWLCGRGGAYVNGTTVLTDGGWLGVVPSSY